MQENCNFKHAQSNKKFSGIGRLNFSAYQTIFLCKIKFFPVHTKSCFKLKTYSVKSEILCNW